MDNQFLLVETVPVTFVFKGGVQILSLFRQKTERMPPSSFFFLLLCQLRFVALPEKLYVCISSYFSIDTLGMEYKKVYTDAELSELVAWFDARQDKLPKEFDLLPGVHISNMHDFILAEKEMIELHHDNPTYGATFCLLFRLREKLQAQGLE